MMNKNKLGISISSDFPEATLEENIKAIKDAGFDQTFFGWNPDTDFSDYIKLHQKYNLELDSLHAPTGGLNCMWKDGADGDDYVKMLCKCVDDAKNFNAPNVVTHHISSESAVCSSKIGIERWKKIVDHALSKGIKICFENVEFPEVLGIVMTEFGNDVGFCYDTGHEALIDPAISYMKLFGDRLACTHIHDNYGISYLVRPYLHGDCHMIPLDATIDFKRVMKDIRSVDYKGTLMLECNRHDWLNTYYDLTVREFYKKSFDALSKIAEY